MIFLQSFMLAALPLVALPILIHLINQRRHRSRRWAAMMFLVQAKRMSRGMARLRHVMIMAMRMLAVAGLILAASRPLATGWLGLTGSRPDTTIIVLDRSASMEQQDLATGTSKRSIGIGKMADLLAKLGCGNRVALIESTSESAKDVETLDELAELPEAGATSVASNMPALLQAAQEYIVSNKTGRTDIWVCSDMRESDWMPDSGKWSELRSGFQQLNGVRFHLLTYDEPPKENVGVTVSNVVRRRSGKNFELTLDVRLHRSGENPESITVPLEFVINGNRSTVNVRMTEAEQTLQGYAIPLDASANRGWGKVQLPYDSVPSDNSYYFVFTEPAARHTVIVSDHDEVASFLHKAVVAPADPSLEYSAETIPPSKANHINWDDAAMIVWHAQLPDGPVAKQLERFVSNGRMVVFFPPEQVNGNRMFRSKWEKWHASDTGKASHVSTWRGDSGLLSHVRSGSALPVGEISALRYCSIDSQGTALARLDTGKTLLTRQESELGAAYFCSTIPDRAYSNLASDGVVAYVMLQRALARGATGLGNAKTIIAGTQAADSASNWKELASELNRSLPSLRNNHAGAYETDNGMLVAMNRPTGEDSLPTVSAQSVQQLFSGLDYRQINDRLGQLNGLASEIWRTFLIVMALALIVEAVLCVPPRKETEAFVE